MEAWQVRERYLSYPDDKTRKNATSSGSGMAMRFIPPLSGSITQKKNHNKKRENRELAEPEEEIAKHSTITEKKKYKIGQFDS